MSAAFSAKTVVFEFTVLSRSQQVTSNLTAPQLSSMFPYSMVEMPSPFPTSPGFFWKNVYKLGGSSGVFSLMPKLETLRTGTETKLLHSLSPWSRHGCAHLCNSELLYQHHKMLNFPWSIFCKVDLKKGFDITAIFKLLLAFEHLCLLVCPPAPKDEHPNHCHHLMLFFTPAGPKDRYESVG